MMAERNSTGSAPDFSRVYTAVAETRRQLSSRREEEATPLTAVRTAFRRRDQSTIREYRSLASYNPINVLVAY